MNVGIFIAGAVVTLIVAVALGLIVYGIVLDGRYLREREAEQERPADPGERRRVPA